MKGLLCSVYRAPRMGDCTNGGITSKHDQVILVDPEDPDGGVFHPDATAPALLLERRTGFEDMIAVPPDPPPPGCIGWMFGGNIIYSSDSRFPSWQPIKVHDRCETPLSYETLTR